MPGDLTGEEVNSCLMSRSESHTVEVVAMEEWAQFSTHLHRVLSVPEREVVLTH